MLLQIHHLIDEEKCFEEVRQIRWPEGVSCPFCEAQLVKKRGFHTHQAHRQRYHCKACGKQFDDLTGTILEGHHQPLKVWILCLYFSAPATARVPGRDRGHVCAGFCGPGRAENLNSGQARSI